MRFLIRRDLLSPRVSGYIMLTFLFALTHYLGFSPYALFILFTLSVLIAPFFYDHYYNMDRFVKSMPIQPSKIVLSRYLSSLFFIVSLVLIQILFMMINTLHPYANTILFYFYTWQDVIIVLSLGIIFVSIVIPIMHFFKSIYLSFTLLGTLFLVGMFLTLDLLIAYTNNSDLIRLDAMNQIIVERFVPGQPYVTLALISIILLICSYFFSVKLFKRKDLA